MNSDRELLELAAKAAGYNIVSWYGEGEPDGPWATCIPRPSENVGWNPLTDDGDALRLAVKLGISLLPYPVYNETKRHSVVVKQRRSSDLLRERNPTEVMEVYGSDPYAATRRAIVRAAAEIGRRME